MPKSIADHPLLAEALEGLRPHLERHDPARLAKRISPSGPMRVKNPKGFSTICARYHHLVFDRVVKVTSDFDAMEQITSMVRRFPTRRTLRKWKMSGDQWLQYQYTLHLVTVSGTVDRCLHVVNAVMRLGLDWRDCSEHILLRHSRLKSTRLANAIKKVVSEVQQLRALRNLDVHRKELPPFYEIIGWDGYDWLPPFALLERVDKGLMDPDILHKGFGYSGKLLATKMQRERTRLKARVRRLFDLLVPIARKEAKLFDLLDRTTSGTALKPRLNAAMVGRT